MRAERDHHAGRQHVVARCVHEWPRARAGAEAVSEQWQSKLPADVAVAECGDRRGHAVAHRATRLERVQQGLDRLFPAIDGALLRSGWRSVENRD